MTGAGNFEQVRVFLLLARAPLFGANVVAAEGGGNYVIGGAVNQPLAGLGNRKHHGVGFAVVVGDLGGRAPKKLDDGVVAEVKLICALQVNHSGERDDASQAGLVSSEAEGELASGRMAHAHDSS